VDVGGVTEIEFKLQIAGARENVTVSAEPRAVETQPRGLSAVIDERAILNLPLNGRRFTDLCLLTSQATQDPRGLNSTSNGDLAFGGIRGFQTSYLVDGGDNNNAFFAQARGRYRAPYQFSNEVIQEFRVSPNSVSAEAGRAGGAVVNVVTKSGSNKFHGAGFYYLRDSRFDAQTSELNIKPTSQQHQFGFTFGGPLRRNRVFFFAGYDQHIFHEPTVVPFVNGGTSVMKNDRLPDVRRNSFVGPDYSSTDMRLSGRLYSKNGWKLEFTAESFNLFNRINRRFQFTDNGAMSNAAQFNFGTKHLGINYFPAYYQVPTNFMHATNAYAPRQLQLAFATGVLSGTAERVVFSRQIPTYCLTLRA